MSPDDGGSGSGRLWGLGMRWLVMTLAVWVSANVVSGVRYDDVQSLLAAALVLGLLNSLVKPLLVLISMPFVILTFGLFLLLINAWLLMLSAKLVKGFHVEGFWSAMGASLIISLLSMLIGKPGQSRRAGGRPRQAGPMEPTPINRPPPGKGPIIDV
ncbi:MAG: phage holin family protein [bacterium]